MKTKHPTPDELQEQRDWRDFKRGACKRSAERLAQRYRPLARKIAAAFCRRASSAVDPDAIESAAMLGLWDAIRGFRPELGYKFATYAPRRIRGAIADECRALDPAGRLQRVAQKDLENRQAAACQAAGHALNGDELIELRVATADELVGPPVPEVASSLLATMSSGSSRQTSRPTLYIDTLEDCGQCEPCRAAERDTTIKAALRGLPFEDQVSLWLYYCRDVTMKEIGRLLELSESRVSQKHAALLTFLREHRAEENAELFRGLGNV